MKKKASYYLYRDKRIFTRQELNEYLEERGQMARKEQGVTVSHPSLSQIMLDNIKRQIEERNNKIKGNKNEELVTEVVGD